MNCCKRNYLDRDLMLNSDIHKPRIKILKKFVKGKTVDVGCGGFMPSVLGVKYACDIVNSSKFLKSLGWVGEFKKADVCKLPYLDKEFKTAICSEVIEHLKTKKAVKQAFNEIDRISERWIVTTPSAYDKDPDHHFHFGYDKDNIFEFIPSELDVVIIRKGYYYYLSNDKVKLSKMLL